MSAASPLFDASVAGSLAGAALYASRGPNPAPAPTQPVFDPSRPPSPAPAPCAAKWRRAVEALLSPISGPRREEV